MEAKFNFERYETRGKSYVELFFWKIEKWNATVRESNMRINEKVKKASFFPSRIFLSKSRPVFN